MKTLFKSATIISMLIFALSSCAEDYLDTEPTAYITPDRVFESTQNAQMAVNGICRMMNGQYLNTQIFNGEGTILYCYGTMASNTLSLTKLVSPDTSLGNLTLCTLTDSAYLYFPWYYYYKLIGDANVIISKIDATPGPEGERKFIKAEALTFRAYSYFMLSQIYCKRWLDSGEGSSSGLVLRLEPGDDPMRLCTLAEVYTQVYSDLDTAIALYDSCGMDRGDIVKRYLPNKDVANAIYSRAAITCRDYQKAYDKATLLIENANYSLMSNAEYKSGFNTPNNEWIWYVFADESQDMRFYAYGAYMAYNSNATQVSSYPKLISKELYDRIPAADIRKELYLDPLTYEYETANNTGVASDALKEYAYSKYPILRTNGSKIYPYMNFKFEAKAQPGVMSFCLFRLAEQYYIAAEAAWNLRQYAKARELLVTLNATTGRNPSYTCTKSGTTLLNEIKDYRAFDLWGEGFDFFDLKRWNTQLSRKTWANGGNFSTAYYAVTTTSRNNWTYMVPLRESDFNPYIYGESEQ